jgi:hypothetical protein
VARLGEDDHLRAGTRLGIGRFLIALAQLNLKLFIYWWQCDWGWHFFLPFSSLPHAFPSILSLCRNHSLQAFRCRIPSGKMLLSWYTSLK